MAAIESVMVLARERLPGEDQLQGRGGSKARRGPLRNRSATVPGTLRRGAGAARPEQSEPPAGNADQRPLQIFVGSAGRAVTQQQLDQYSAKQDQTLAAENLAKANLKTAELNLHWTKVESPISGRLSRTLVTRGNLVVADQTLLTNIVSQDPIYAYFDVDEPTVLRMRELIRQGKFRSAREQGVHVPVYLGLANEQGYPHQGEVDFLNNQIEASTATLQIRAVFPNPQPPVGDRVLYPGLFVRIRVPIGLPHRAILISEQAIGADQNVSFVYVVDGQNKVVRHDVKPGMLYDGLRVITEGIGPNDRVIVSGLQRVRPGAVVEPRLVSTPSAETRNPKLAIRDKSQ